MQKRKLTAISAIMAVVMVLSGATLLASPFDLPPGLPNHATPPNAFPNHRWAVPSPEPLPTPAPTPSPAVRPVLVGGDGLAAPWTTSYGHKGITARQMPETNGVLAASIGRFYDENAHTITNYFSGLQQPGTWERGYHNLDMDLSDLLSCHIRTGWAADSFQAPFNLSYMNRILNNTHFYLTRTQTGGMGGNYVIRLYDAHVWINVPQQVSFTQAGVGINNPRDAFVRSVLREFGHALGLGVNLAEFFAEIHMGRQAADIQNAIEQTRPLEERYAIFTELEAVSRNSVFVRSLHELLNSQYRAYMFWQAAFHSNAAFANLWNDNYGHVVRFECLQTAKAVDALLRGNSAVSFQLRTDFNAWGRDFEQLGNDFIEAWRVLTGELNFVEFAGLHGYSYCFIATRYAELRQWFNDTVHTYTHFAYINGISAADAVSNHALQLHERMFGYS